MLKRLPIVSTNRPIDCIKHWRDEGILQLNAPYQRGDVWGTNRRVNLIRSILLGIPIASIMINDRMSPHWKDWEYVVIDGKQRCTTILMFLDDALPVPGEWFDTTGSIMFSELPIATQRGIRQYGISFVEAKLETIEQETEAFELINFGGLSQGYIDEIDYTN